MKQKKVNYPQKTTINLVIREKTALRPSRTLPLISALIVLALLFGKFAVADQLTRIYTEQAQLQAVQTQLAQLQADTADYADISELHSRYATGWETEQEQILQGRLAALALVEETLMPQAVLKNYSVLENTISVSLEGLTLDDTSQLLAQLSASPIVQDVDVFTAATQQEGGVNTTVSIMITLHPAVEEGSEE